MAKEDWKLVYDVVRRDGINDRYESALVSNSGGIEDLQEARELVEMLKKADFEIGSMMRNYAILPLMQHKDFGVSPQLNISLGGDEDGEPELHLPPMPSDDDHGVS